MRDMPQNGRASIVRPGELIAVKEKAMDGYLTTLGRTGEGNALNETLGDALRYTADILRRAATEKLNVYMLCNSLGSELRAQTFAKATKSTFNELVEKVLVAGRNISIFVWGDPSREKVSEEFVRLLREYEQPRAGRGVLDVRAGSPEKAHSQPVTHFLMAIGTTGARKKPRSFIRIELPHAPFTPKEISDLDTPAHATLFFNKLPAMIQACDAGRIFRKLFVAAGGPVSELDADLSILQQAIKHQHKSGDKSIQSMLSKPIAKPAGKPGKATVSSHHHRVAGKRKAEDSVGLQNAVFG